MRRLLVLLMAPLLCAACASAGNASVLRRGLEATSMRGSFYLLADASAPDGEIIVLRRNRPAVARVQTVPTRELDVTLAGGCERAAQILVGVDHMPPVIAPVGSRTWHVLRIRTPLRQGRHSVVLFARWPARDHRPCAAPKIDRVDFLPTYRRDYVLLGAAVRDHNLMDDASYRDLFTSEFDSMTPENEMKMDSLEPSDGHYNFREADAMVAYAISHGKAVRGHTLVFGSQLPPWITVRLLPWRSSSLLGVMRSYITTVMQHYESSVDTWDVVNEAFNPNGTYTRNIWFRVIGPSYIEDAFRFARAADPQAELFYNDQAWVRGPKEDQIFQLIAGFRRRGVPVDGVGLQDHVDLDRYPVEDQLERSFSAYARLGVRVEITEMDVGTLDLLAPPAEREADQAAVYRQDATACWDIADCHRLTTWGVYDGLSWIGSAQAPLLFDTSYQPKPAYAAVQSALHLSERPRS